MPITEGTTQEGLSVKDQLSILSERLRRQPWKIGIDGQAAAGKGTLAEHLSQLLGLDKIETGRMYRAVTYWLTYCRKLENPDQETDAELKYYHLPNLKINFVDNEKGKKRVIIKHPGLPEPLDITDELEDPKIGMVISQLAKRDPIRDFLDREQLSLLQQGKAVIEGRDMWQIARPYVDILIYLYADDKTLMEREKKRHTERGKPILDEIAKKIVVDRNNEDYNRTRGKLMTPEEAKRSKKYDIVIDTSHLTPEEIVLLILQKLEEVDQRKRQTLTQVVRAQFSKVF